MAVGKSSRTPFKHWLLNKHLGKIVGVLSNRSKKVPAVADPFHCIDLCAGDGVSVDTSEFKHECSPKIITSHCNWLANYGFNVESTYIEMRDATYEQLKANVNAFHFAPTHKHNLLHQDAREYEVVPTIPRQAIFVNCDPNTISDMPLAKPLAKSLTEMTTLTMTLGCNVGGLKRLPAAEREEWFCYVQDMIDIMPSWHDAFLVELKRDGAQWAYLTRIPSVWSKEHVAIALKAGNDMWPNGVRVASFRDDRLGFDNMLDRLFRTKKERGE